MGWTESRVRTIIVIRRVMRGGGGGVNVGYAKFFACEYWTGGVDFHRV